VEREESRGRVYKMERGRRARESRAHYGEFTFKVFLHKAPTALAISPDSTGERKRNTSAHVRPHEYIALEMPVYPHILLRQHIAGLVEEAIHRERVSITVITITYSDLDTR